MIPVIAEIFSQEKIRRILATDINSNAVNTARSNMQRIQEMTLEDLESLLRKNTVAAESIEPVLPYIVKERNSPSVFFSQHNALSEFLEESFSVICTDPPYGIQCNWEGRENAETTPIETFLKNVRSSLQQNGLVGLILSSRDFSSFEILQSIQGYKVLRIIYGEKISTPERNIFVLQKV